MISWRLGWALATLATAILILVAGSVHYAFRYVEARMTAIGDVQNIEHNVPLGDARKVDVDLVLAISDLSVSGGATGMMEAKTTHYTPPLYTTTTYSVTEGIGTLVFAHANPDVVPRFERPPEYQSVGEIKLNNSVPMSLTITMGVHQGRLNLADLTLRSLHISVVDGSCEIDLRDDWQNSFDIEIESGFGESVILLPAETGVRLRFAEENEGTVAMEGLTQHGNFFVNDVWGVSPVTLELTVTGDEGRIRLVVDASEPSPR